MSHGEIDWLRGSTGDHGEGTFDATFEVNHFTCCGILNYKK